MRAGKSKGSKNSRDNGLGGFFKQPIDGQSSSYVQIFGSRTVSVEGCQGVLAYSGEQIKLSMGARSFVVLGSELKITGMYGSSVTIEGHVCGTEFR